MICYGKSSDRKQPVKYNYNINGNANKFYWREHSATIKITAKRHIGEGSMKKVMGEQKKEKLIKIYKIYNIFDWILVLTIAAMPAVFVSILTSFELRNLGLGWSDLDSGVLFSAIETFAYYLGNLPAISVAIFFILSTFYTVFNIVLFVMVWPIKEIRKGFVYWLDWFLAVLLVAYELLIFYAIFFG